MNMGYNQRLIRAIACSTAVALMLPVPAYAQFGSLLRSIPKSGGSKTTKGCDDSAGKAVGRSVIGGMLGSLASRAGVSSFLPVPEVSGLLTDAIACKLEPEEQKKAANATLEVTRGEQVGGTSSWTSETRKGVSGTSTVVGKTQIADGSTCMNVNDVIIVEGEETTVTKRMCKKPGAARYEIAQA